MTCPTFEQLFAAAGRQLPADELLRIHQHVDAECDVCCREFRYAQSILAAAACPEYRQPPAWLIEQAVEQVMAQMTDAAEALTEQIPVRLLFDSFMGATLAGVRNGGHVARQVVYQVGEYNINLIIRRAVPSQTISIMGQAIPLHRDFSAVAQAQVELWQEAQLVQTVGLNHHGLFMFDSLSEGIYDLCLRLEETSIKIVGFCATTGADRTNAVN